MIHHMPEKTYSVQGGRCIFN